MLAPSLRDVDHRDPGCCELANYPEQVFDLLRIEHSRRLIHDDQFDVMGESPRHADDLFARGREQCHFDIRRYVTVAQPIQDCARCAVGAAGSQHAKSVELVAQKNVLSHSQAFDDIELLVHGCDTESDGGKGI
jgi:hypothetical protein